VAGRALYAGIGMTINLPGHPMLVTYTFLAMNDCTILFGLPIHLNRFKVIEWMFICRLLLFMCVFFFVFSQQRGVKDISSMFYLEIGSIPRKKPGIEYTQRTKLKRLHAKNKQTCFVTLKTFKPTQLLRFLTKAIIFR